MRNFLLIMFLGIAFSMTKAQNIQLHYDLGEDREYFTTTVEMFKPDKWGNTFFFIDMNYHTSGELNGVNSAYFEIARTLKLSKKVPVSLHAEYNGGLFQANKDITVNINNAWLGGLDYSWNKEDFSAGYSLKALFKHIVDKHDASFQITGVWYYHFLNKKMTFRGFLDFWREDMDLNFDGKAKKYVFLTEPQIWYNITEHLAVGSEVEFSNNFVAEEFKVMPTVAAKWEF